ncbi:MAG: NTP transferase domain-containing protein [Candidatus Saccharimonadales bacterium]
MTEQYEIPSVNQVVIAAGGRGKRMGSEMGSVPCKSLLEYRGQTMLGWLLDSLQANGFDDYLIATNAHCVDGVSAVLQHKGIAKPPATIDIDEGFRRVPRHFEGQLADRFLFLSGHHPVSAEHIGKMLVKATVHPIVMTAYDNGKYTLDSLHSFIVEDEAGEPVKIREKFLVEEDLADTFTYVRHPYIVSPEAVQRATDDNYNHIFGTYVFRGQESKGGIGIVTADFAPEFDYPEQFEVTKQDIDRRLSK